MASPLLQDINSGRQGQRQRKWLERTGEENSWKPPPLPPELFFASGRTVGWAKLICYLQQAMALIWKCIPRKKQWEPSCGGGSIRSRGTALLGLNLQSLFQAALHCIWVMLEFFTRGCHVLCSIVPCVLVVEAAGWASGRSSWGM